MALFLLLRGLEKKQILNSKEGKDILNTNIAIPIMLKRSLKEYKQLANNIYNIKKN